MNQVGNLLKGAVDSSGEFKDAALQVGIKLDLVGLNNHAEDGWRR